MKKFIILLCFLVSCIVYAEEQLFAELGDIVLENGLTLENCRLGYRILGEINEEKSNVILIPMWYAGVSKDAKIIAQPNGIIDTNIFCAIIIDTLGNGVSSSPSNSKTQPNEKFPQFSIKDCVQIQHKFLTEILHLNHIHAIVGGSMGGMQAWEWAVSYPDFMNKIIAYVSSPCLTSYELLSFLIMVNYINTGHKCNIPEREILHQVHLLFALNAFSPKGFVNSVPRDSFEKFVASCDYVSHQNSWDLASQIQAMAKHNIAEKYNNDWDKVAERIQAKIFVIASLQDHLVYPQPALDFAKKLNAQTYSIDSEFGHLATSRFIKELAPLTQQFLLAK